VTTISRQPRIEGLAVDILKILSRNSDRPFFAFIKKIGSYQ